MNNKEYVVFENDELWDIVNGDHEFAQKVSEETHREAWYQFHDVVFAHDGVHYTFSYKEHTSPNILDREIIKDATPIENQPITVDSEEEARFIWKELMKRGKSHMSVEDIMDVTDLQYEYMIKLGLVE